jgi:hypothetical protein
MLSLSLVFVVRPEKNQKQAGGEGSAILNFEYLESVLNLYRGGNFNDQGPLRYYTLILSLRSPRSIVFPSGTSCHGTAQRTERWVVDSVFMRILS